MKQKQWKLMKLFVYRKFCYAIFLVNSGRSLSTKTFERDFIMFDWGVFIFPNENSDWYNCNKYMFMYLLSPGVFQASMSYFWSSSIVYTVPKVKWTSMILLSFERPAKNILWTSKNIFFFVYRVLVIQISGYLSCTLLLYLTLYQLF